MQGIFLVDGRPRMINNYVLEMSNVSKSFPGVRALDQVSFSCFAGEVHAIAGENGAGKSTLMKILSGIYRPDEGTIKVSGTEVVINNPRIAQDLGINIVNQELNQILNLDVAQNIFLGREPINKLGFIDSHQIYLKATELLDRIGIKLDVRSLLIDLSPAEKQIVEICKAISFTSKILIMDEPSSSLSDQEAKRLFEIIERLKKSGIAVIYISHRIDDLFEIADRVTVLKDGAAVTTTNMNELTQKDLVNLMVGRVVENLYPEKGNCVDDLLLGVDGLTRDGKFNNISFKVNRNEIVGIAGIVGSGRTEVVRAIFGADSFDAGRIIFDGNEIKIRKPKDAISHGFCLVPEDMRSQGLILSLSIRNNIVLAVLDRLKKLIFTSTTKEKLISNRLINKLNIKPPDSEHNVEVLSGGNKQKVVIAKWLATTPRLIILDEPTKGIDVGAKVEIHKIIRELANDGAGVILVSSELPEIIGMSDRVYVMCNGEISPEFSGDQITEEEIMKVACATSITNFFRNDL